MRYRTVIERIGKMEQTIIAQYINLTKEVEEIKENIRQLEERKSLMEKGTVNDSVKGGYGGKQLYKINSYAKADIEETEYLINKNIRILKQREKEVHETIIYIEEYINKVNDSRMRRMITFKYVKGMTWNQTAMAMGDSYTADGCRMDMKRFFEKK